MLTDELMAHRDLHVLYHLHLRVALGWGVMDPTEAQALNQEIGTTEPIIWLRINTLTQFGRRNTLRLFAPQAVR